MATLYNVLVSVHTAEMDTSLVNLMNESMIFALSAIFFGVDFLLSAVLQLIGQAIVFLLIFPTIFENVTVDLTYLLKFYILALINFAFLFVADSIIYYSVSIVVENRHKSIEYSQLLNQVKSGLIMLKDMTNKGTI